MKSLPSGIPSFCSPCNLSRLCIIRWSPQLRYVHSTSTKAAVAHTINVHGPPPRPPEPAPGYSESIERRRRRSERINCRETETGSAKPNPLKRRFWKHVHVNEGEEGFQVLLDTRPIRTPAKNPLIIPRSKPHLAHAIALEWDLLESAQHALKTHRIPLTSLVSRAQDIAAQDERGETTIRDEIARVMIRYLDTDTILSWAPEKNIHEPHEAAAAAGVGSLRELQIRTARPIIGFLVNHLWPGVQVNPTLEEDSIMPIPQSQETRDVLRGWVASLPAFEIAGLERGVLASKSFLVAARLVVEWSENFRHLQQQQQQATSLRTRFGVEAAAQASSLEVTWQTGRWGEVEDTHDVDREDLRRQLGSVVVLVSGESNR